MLCAKETSRWLDGVVERSRDLYSLPAVAMRVLELSQDPSVDIRSFRECIERDPALAARVLRVVNSSMFGLTRQVDDLGQALSLLGIRPLKLIVLGFSLPDAMFDGVENGVLRHFWQLSLGRAMAARELGPLLKRPSEDAFLAGLLYDIGLLVLIKELGETYLRCVKSVIEDGEDLRELESSSIGFDHVTVSARLMHYWKLPANIVAAAEAPPDPSRLQNWPVQERQLVQTVYLADRIAALLSGNRKVTMSGIVEIADSFGYSLEGELDPLLERVTELVNSMGESLSAPLPSAEVRRDILDLARRQLALAAEAAAVTLVQDRQIEKAPPPLPASTLGEAPRISRPGADGRRDVHRAFSYDPGLIGRAKAFLARGHQSRAEVSLLLVELEEYAQHVFGRGEQGTDELVQRIHETIEEALPPSADLIHTGEGRFSILLPDMDRVASVEWAKCLLVELAPLQVDGEHPHVALVHFSMGLATVRQPHRGAPVEPWLEAAEACLRGSRVIGGGVKSIEI